MAAARATAHQQASLGPGAGPGCPSLCGEAPGAHFPEPVEVQTQGHAHHPPGSPWCGRQVSLVQSRCGTPEPPTALFAGASAGAVPPQFGHPEPKTSAVRHADATPSASTFRGWTTAQPAQIVRLPSARPLEKYLLAARRCRSQAAACCIGLWVCMWRAGSRESATTFLCQLRFRTASKGPQATMLPDVERNESPCISRSAAYDWNRGGVAAHMIAALPTKSSDD